MAVQEERRLYFVSNIDEAPGVVAADTGENEVFFRGAIGLEVTQREKGKMSLNLIRLNLVTDGVKSEGGDTGVIGLKLAEPEYKTDFDPSSGKLQAKFNLVLHYPLIDEKMGFREVPSEDSEDADYLVPYTEVMAGTLTARLPEELTSHVPEKFGAECRIEATIYTPVLEAVTTIMVAAPFDWISLFGPAEILRIQPVFFGSGPADPNATGGDFNTLMGHARDMWNRCGTERCISFAVQPPVYIDNDDLRVLSSIDEAWSLRLEHSDSNAVEVFVAEAINSPQMWGGGICFDLGAADAFVVTSDQQLHVPCPPPCSGGGACGDVNYYHLAHELGHVLGLYHPGEGTHNATPGSVMEPSGLCADNPNTQTARNCRNTSNPLLTFGTGWCWGSPDVDD